MGSFPVRVEQGDTVFNGKPRPAGRAGERAGDDVFRLFSDELRF